jgi:hypothetical protein
MHDPTTDTTPQTTSAETPAQALPEPSGDAVTKIDDALASGELEALQARNAELEQQLADIRSAETRQAASQAFSHSASERGLTVNEQAMQAFDWGTFTDGDSVNDVAISAVLDLFTNRPKFAQGLGIGPQGHNKATPAGVSLDARHRR